MIAEFFMMAVGAIIIVSLPIVWLGAIDAINAQRADEEYTILQSFEKFILHCDPEAKIYVSPEVWMQFRKNDMLDFIPSFESDGVVAYYLGRVIEEDKNEPFFRAEKE